jgi:hypothetical protein
MRIRVLQQLDHDPGDDLQDDVDGRDKPGHDGQKTFVAFVPQFVSGPDFKFTEAVSFVVHCETPFKAVNGWPSSSKAAVMTLPLGPGPMSP